MEKPVSLWLIGFIVCQRSGSGLVDIRSSNGRQVLITILGDSFIHRYLLVHLLHWQGKGVNYRVFWEV